MWCEARHPPGLSGFLWDSVSPLAARHPGDGGHEPLGCVRAELFGYTRIFICASFGNFSSWWVLVQYVPMGRGGMWGQRKRG